MSCNYAEGLSPYDNKGRLGAPEKFDSAPDIRAKVDQLADMVKQAKHIGKQRHTDLGGTQKLNNHHGISAKMVFKKTRITYIIQ